jgi:hypothetical protein
MDKWPNHKQESGRCRSEAHAKLFKQNRGEMAEWLKAAVC